MSDLLQHTDNLDIKINAEQAKSNVTQEYISGIKEGRKFLEKYGNKSISVDSHIENIRSTLKGFSGKSPVGQILKGELDFWLNQKKMGK